MPAAISQLNPLQTDRHEGGAGGTAPATPHQSVIPEAGLVRKILFCVTKPLSGTMESNRTAYLHQNAPNICSSRARTFLTLCFTLTPLSPFAAINASQTMVLQTAGTERARLNTLGFETNRISTTYISATYIQIPNPTANNQAVTKQYVDTAIAAGGGGSCTTRPTYMGRTPSSYNGILGGGSLSTFQKGNTLCAATFPGSRMLLSSEVARTDFTTPIESSAWIHCDAVTYNGSSLRCASFPDVLSGYVNCENWTETWSARYGITLGTNYLATGVGCNATFPIHCVKD